MPACPAARLLALTLLLCLLGAGAADAARRDPVARTLARLADQAKYPADELDAWARDWRSARSAARRLHGSARRDMAGVVANTSSLASRGLLGGGARGVVGNGFAQALLGLDSYRELSGDPRAARLVEQGLAQARRNLPRFDTGAWSLYYRTPRGPGMESDLHYHRVFAGFLAQMCDRFAEPRYCRLHEHFSAYETEPVAISGLRARRARRRLVVRLRVSKRSFVTVTVRSRGRALRTASRNLLRGPERFDFLLPRGRSATVEVEAASLTGIRSWSSVASRPR